MTKVAIIGCGGHTRSSINLLLNYTNSQDISIYDNSFREGKKEIINSIPLIGSIDDIDPDQDVFLSIGDNNLRKMYFLQYKNQIISNTFFHNDSIQEENVTLGVANQVFAFAYINSDVIIGDDNIINTGVIIEHESSIGNHSHISIGVKICRRVTIGDLCLIGAGVVILDKVSICSNVTIGAGSVVTRDINVPGVYAGIPAKKIHHKQNQINDDL